jgi:hypothetical protein
METFYTDNPSKQLYCLDPEPVAITSYAEFLTDTTHPGGGGGPAWTIDPNWLGRIKGSSSHSALMSGGYANGVVIDSPYGTVTYESGVGNNIDMSAVLDMSTDTLVTANPFAVVSGLIAVDSANYGTLNKPANIKFKQVSHNNPRIMKDGDECVAPTCTNVVHDTTLNTLAADVTGFSNYTVGGYNATYTKDDLQPIVEDGLGTVGAETVQWLDLMVVLIVLGFIVASFVGIGALAKR